MSAATVGAEDLAGDAIDRCTSIMDAMAAIAADVGQMIRRRLLLALVRWLWSVLCVVVLLLRPSNHCPSVPSGVSGGCA